ncbi:Terpenoid synthase [Dirofilaria immitis]
MFVTEILLFGFCWNDRIIGGWQFRFAGGRFDRLDSPGCFGCLGRLGRRLALVRSHVSCDRCVTFFCRSSTSYFDWFYMGGCESVDLEGMLPVFSSAFLRSLTFYVMEMILADCIHLPGTE